MVRSSKEGFALLSVSSQCQLKVPSPEIGIRKLSVANQDRLGDGISKLFYVRHNLFVNIPEFLLTVHFSGFLRVLRSSDFLSKTCETRYLENKSFLLKNGLVHDHYFIH